MPNRHNNNRPSYSTRPRTQSHVNNGIPAGVVGGVSRSNSQEVDAQALADVRARSYSEVVQANGNIGNPSARSTPERTRQRYSDSNPPLRHQISQLSLRTDSTGSAYSSTSSLHSIADELLASGNSRNSNNSNNSGRRGPNPPQSQRPAQPPPPPPAASGGGVSLSNNIFQQCFCDGQFATTTINTLEDIMKLITSEERLQFDELVEQCQSRLHRSPSFRSMCEIIKVMDAIRALRSTQQRLISCPRLPQSGANSVQSLSDAQCFLSDDERQSFVKTYQELLDVLTDYGVTADELKRHREDLMENVYQYLANSRKREDNQVHVDTGEIEYRDSIIEFQRMEIDRLRNENRRVIVALRNVLQMNITINSTWNSGSGTSNGNT